MMTDGPRPAGPLEAIIDAIRDGDEIALRQRVGGIGSRLELPDEVIPILEHPGLCWARSWRCCSRPEPTPGPAAIAGAALFTAPLRPGVRWFVVSWLPLVPTSRLPTRPGASIAVGHSSSLAPILGSPATTATLLSILPPARATSPSAHSSSTPGPIPPS